VNNLFDMIRAAQGGTGIDSLARQFGLQNNQVQSALEALLPAFSMGLQKQAENPASMFEMFGKAAQGPFADMFDQGAQQQEAQSAGNDILGSLFGSKDMSRAVAAQASAVSGIGASVMKAMLPVIASMLMGGMMKNMFNGQGGPLGGILSSMFGGGQQASTGGGMGDILGQMMGGNAPGGTSAGTPAGGGLGDLLGGMFGGQNNASQGGGGLGDLLSQMMGGGQQAAPQGAASQGSANPMDAFNEMFQAGAKVQQTHMDGLQSIFDQFLGKRA
jgi:hypothetical protein